MKASLTTRKMVITAGLMAVCASAFSDMARIAVKVIDDETGEPIKGVSVIGSFRDNIGWRAWTESVKPDLDRKTSDKEGSCLVSGETNCGDASFWVKSVPTGYYKVAGQAFQFKQKNVFGIWQPDNLVATIRLQRVEHPIPLFVKKVMKVDWKNPVGGFDGTNAVMRYDLVHGDWLPPDGNGEIADIAFSIKLTSHDADDVGKPYQRTFYTFEYIIEFLGAGNGLYNQIVNPTAGIGLRTAPKNAYVHQTRIRQGRRRHVIGANSFAKKFTDADPNRCYAFRIRSEFDDKGRLTGGYYGKIYGDFEFREGNRASFLGLEFLYYLNPVPLDRNLEWDMKGNLCTNPNLANLPQP